jgi:uncharacterized membrane protein
MSKPKKISWIILIVFYAVAGVNHFYNPESYIKIIPAYFPYPQVLNYLAGFCELWFAMLLIFPKTRNGAAWGIILMLIAFIPVHVQMVIDAPFLLGGTITVSPFVAWVRLVVLQPLLILWAWWHTKADKV